MTEHRKITAQQFLFLAGEVQAWKAQGLVSTEDGDAILKGYELAEEQTQTRHTGLLTLMGLGVFLLGLSVMLLVGYNWHLLTGTLKIGIVLTALGVSTGLAAFWAKRGCNVLSEVAFLLGATMFGVCIWQIAQVFHVSTHFPEGVWLWAVGSLLLAIGTRSVLTHLLTVVLLVIWFHLEMLGFQNIGPGPLRDVFPDFPNAAWTLPALVCLGFYASRIAVQSARVLETVRFFYTLAFCWWLMYLPIACRFCNGSSFYYVFLGALMVLVSRLLERRTAANQFVYTAGLLTLAIGLIPFSYTRGWIRCALWNSQDVRLLLASLSTLAAVLVACWWSWLAMQAGRQQQRRSRSMGWNVFLVIVLVHALVLQALVSVGTVSLGLFEGETARFAMVLWQNVLMFTLALLSIHTGLRRSCLSMFVFGVMYFLLWAILRYFDLFSDFAGMLGASGLFFFCAVTMFGFAWFWRHTQKKMQETGSNSEEQKNEALQTLAETAGQDGAAVSGVASALSTSIRWRLMWTLGVVALLFVQLTSMVVYYNEPYVKGQEIVVVSRPVDPRDLFRGRYVVLNYDFNQPLRQSEIETEMNGMPQFSSISGGEETLNAASGRTVYAVMEPIAGTNLWQAKEFTLKQPTEGVFLKGCKTGYRIRYGIEQFFAQEDVAKAIDKELAWTSDREKQKQAHVTLSVLPDGRCAVKKIEVVPVQTGQ